MMHREYTVTNQEEINDIIPDAVDHRVVGLVVDDIDQKLCEVTYVPSGYSAQVSSERLQEYLDNGYIIAI